MNYLSIFLNSCFTKQIEGNKPKLKQEICPLTKLWTWHECWFKIKRISNAFQLLWLCFREQENKLSKKLKLWYNFLSLSRCRRVFSLSLSQSLLDCTFHWECDGYVLRTWRRRRRSWCPGQCSHLQTLITTMICSIRARIVIYKVVIIPHDTRAHTL